MRAVIMAGGKGTRLSSLTKDQIPKGLYPIAGKPILEWQLIMLKKYGISDVTMVIGRLGELIKDYFGDGSSRGFSIDYITEPEPLGTAGNLYYLKETEPFLFVMGDIFFDFDIRRMIDYHTNKQAFVTLLAHPNMHPFDSDLVVTDNDGRVLGFDSKHNIRDYWYDNLVNSGIFIMDPGISSYVKKPEKMSLEKDLLSGIIDRERIYAYRTPEFVRDVGTPDRVEATERDFASGLIAAKNLENRQKAIFIDRDGTLNKYKGFITDPEDIELEENAAEAVRLINESGYLAIVTTNQPVIARGECTREKLGEIHRKIKTLLGREGAYVDDIIYCPHHPDKGFEGEVPELKIECSCRKPKTGMIDRAASEYNIDVTQSWVVGDATIDIAFGKNAGCRTILVKTGVAGEDKKYDAAPDHIDLDLLEAVRRITAEEQKEGL
ncbi:MAG: HAD-IIIA family hydrolase [Lachnospiraceae bacterium]|nr:HAD-IIIA family hydrolase [Lachnospiraceae bacterium]